MKRLAIVWTFTMCTMLLVAPVFARANKYAGKQYAEPCRASKADARQVISHVVNRSYDPEPCSYVDAFAADWSMFVTQYGYLPRALYAYVFPNRSLYVGSTSTLPPGGINYTLKYSRTIVSGPNAGDFVISAYRGPYQRYLGRRWLAFQFEAPR
jgi:hypothetical protein